MKTETTHILTIVIDQNYFQFDLEYYEQNDGLAMGAPTSAISAETYIRSMEHTQIHHILNTQQIIAYFRYVDDILIIYDNKNTDIKQTLNEFNKLTTCVKVHNRKRRT
jgi:hypothetical protein